MDVEASLLVWIGCSPGVAHHPRLVAAVVVLVHQLRDAAVVRSLALVAALLCGRRRGRARARVG